jgi:hypothetical protein
MRLSYSDTPVCAYGVASSRALAFLKRQPRDKRGRRIPVKAAQVADEIWPDHRMTSQGAGGAASRILHQMEQQQLCEWIARGDRSWGWVAL